MESERGTFYAVGVGPGDPELMTRKAVRVLEECPVLAVPRTPAGDSLALEIAQAGADLTDKEIHFIDFAMSRDEEKRRQAHRRAAEAVRALLDRGTDVAMPVLGDVSLFASSAYVAQLLEEEGCRCVRVPGVPSFCAAAARLGRSLCEGSQRLLIVPASHKDVGDCLDMDANLVFMKAGRDLGALKETLRRRGLLDRASLAANCGMAGEQLWLRFGDAPENTPAHARAAPGRIINS